MYRLSTGGAIPISHYLLHEQMGPGFYWLLRQAYAGGWRRGNVGRSAFGDYMGKIFQLYIGRAVAARLQRPERRHLHDRALSRLV